MYRYTEGEVSVVLSVRRGAMPVVGSWASERLTSGFVRLLADLELLAGKLFVEIKN